ncbi:MAG TPA: energy transducer TonB [Terriglobales bacterium]|nr:energy transducer TonB [Terriglobales bacterium]
MVEDKPKLELGGARVDTGNEQKQRRRMLLAVALLLAALGVILVKDRQLWFGSDDASTADTDTDDSVITPGSTSPSAHPSSAAVAKAKKHVAVKEEVAAAAPPPSIVTNRTALPPLEIEVVAGDNRRTVRPGSNSVKVDMNVAGTPATATATASGPAVSASQRVRMSADTAHVLERPVDPSYPMLARQMKVQGSVILQALIGTDGLIQDLHVLSGPAILSSAAQEAVRQWRFKPYLQNGQPVETEAKITVNFTISTF